MSSPETNAAYDRTWRDLVKFFAERWPGHAPECASPPAVAVFLRSMRAQDYAEASRRRAAYALAAQLKSTNPDMWDVKGLPDEVEASLDDEGDAKFAAASIARQKGNEPWFAGVRVVNSEAGPFVELLARQAIHLTAGRDRVRGVRVVPVVVPPQPQNGATTH